MAHWLDLRQQQLVLERVLHTEEDQLIFTAHNSNEELFFYIAKNVSGELQVAPLHHIPLSHWGAPGQAYYFSPLTYQVLYNFDGSGLKTLVVGLCLPLEVAGGTDESLVHILEPSVLLELEGEHSIVFLDANTLLAFPVDGGAFSAYGSLAGEYTCGANGIIAFEKLTKGGCFEQWPLIAPREMVLCASQGWAIWEDAYSEDYDRAENAIKGEAQPDEALWSLTFRREGDTLVGERMPIVVASARGWTRSIGLDFKGRLWFRTGEVASDHQEEGEILESIWSLSLESLQLPQPIERYKRRASVLTTSAYDSHLYFKASAGYALYQITKTENQLDVKALFGDTYAATVKFPGQKTHFEGKWSNGYIFSECYESEETNEMYERLHFQENWPDAPWKVTDAASCTISGQWCILCLKSL